jgi:hypothetical protein
MSVGDTPEARPTIASRRRKPLASLSALLPESLASRSQRLAHAFPLASPPVVSPAPSSSKSLFALPAALQSLSPRASTSTPREPIDEEDFVSALQCRCRNYR